MLLTVIGARPQFIKAASVSHEFIKCGIEEIIIHTGQHYDDKMSNIFWEELKIPKPVLNLNVGSGNHASQTANIMIGLEKFILSQTRVPKAIVLYGDTNSTIAGAIVASKLNIPIVHIEAGLRSFDRKMPEEINRIVTDQLSSILFCPSQEAMNNLKNEGILKNVYDVGDVMYDSFTNFSKYMVKPKNIELQNELFSLFTLHRPSNTDSSETLGEIIKSLGQIEQKIIWPVHPRIKNILEGLPKPKNIFIIEPLTYFEMLWTLHNCYKVITDSGGLQKEAYWAKKQCFTLRSSTEWVETLEGSWNSLIGFEGLPNAFFNVPTSTWKPLYGNGDTSKKNI